MNILNDLSKIPDAMYFKAIKTLEIIQVVLLNKESKKKYKNRKDFNNEKDIIVVAGDKDYINRFFSRDDIVKNFTNLNGTKIKLGGWHYNTKYNLCRLVNKPVAILKVPNRLSGIKSKYRSSLFVFNINNDKIDIGRYYVVKNKGGLKLFRITHKVVSKPNIEEVKKQLKERATIIDMTKERIEMENKTYRNPLLEKKEEDVILGAPYTVICSLLKRNNVGKSIKVGFRVKRKKDGVERDCNFVNVKKMCISREIDNITIVHMEDTGKEHFRGVGIKIENLPTKYV